jgi:hypothetical protein
MNRLIGVVTVLGGVISVSIPSFATRVRAAAESSPEYKVSGKGIAVRLSAKGEIVSVIAGGREINATGRTSLEGCTQAGAAKAEELSGGAVEFTRTLQDSASGRTLTVVDRFKPAGDSVRWEISVVSEGKPWTKVITTELNYPATPATRFWTAWSDPVWSTWSDPDKETGEWRDPMVLRPLIDATWTYGGSWNTTPDHIVLPLATVAEPGEDFGLSLVLSPEDTILVGSRLATTPSGSLRFSRANYRLGGGKAVRFAMNLLAHEADWRGGLRWMTARYSEFFEPPNPRADEMAGCAAYSGDEEPIDVAKYKKMAFRVNWKLDDDMAYMGMFIPPVTDADERWERSWHYELETPDKPHWTSVRQMNNYAHYLKANGFYLLDYFDVYNYGDDTPSSEAQKPGAPLWRSSSAFLAANFPHAQLESNREVFDCGDPDFEKFLLEQAERDVRWIPDSAGICIDETFFAQLNNNRADDGVSWVDGGPVRALSVSWNDLFSKLSPIMHGAGKVLYASPLFARLDAYRLFDGFYDEYGYDGRGLNSSAFLGLDKPVMVWTYNESLFRPDPDTFFQRHLLMGAYPTAPYPWNNHCVLPDMTWDDFYYKFAALFERDTGHRWMKTEQYYLDYGPLLDAMRGKKWVLAPHCVEVAGGAAKVNLFKVPGGYAMPICFGGKAESADVTIRNVAGLDNMKYSVIHPGVEKLATPTIVSKDKNGAATLRVPLLRGCAMVTLRR